MEKKYWIKDLTEKQVIHAPTLEIAQRLCKKFDELGFKWCWGDSYLKSQEWEHHKGKTCYRLTIGNFGSKKWYEENSFEILTIDQLLDFDEPLKIEVGKFYRTRGGVKVRIYAVESNGDLPIHGAVESNNVWTGFNWDEDGFYNKEEGLSKYDIIEEWEDELEFDVSVIPTFRYLAMDADGYWTMYSKSPDKSDDHWYSIGDSLCRYLDKKDCPKNYNGSWRESLHEIVDEKLVKVKQ